VTSPRRLGLGLGAGLGVVGLAVLLVFAVAVPHLTSADEVELPDSLPGGWVGADIAAVPDLGSGAEAFKASRERATAYVREVYAEVYDDPVAFRAYTDKELSRFVVVTVFTSDGGAFGPPSGLADPEALKLERATTELVRDGDVVCVANYQPVAEGEDGGADADTPLGVSCQLPTEGHTIQLATSGMSVDDTVQLVHDVASAI
jgi:hypothetical protein